MHNLLTEPLLPVDLEAGIRREVDLPSLLAALAGDEVIGFPFLRAHQAHPWHAFLVQLAAIALHRAREVDIQDQVETWRELLCALTIWWSDDAPWRLVVEDLAQPAFMQPPVPEGSLVNLKNIEAAPDDLDVLVTSKNHGVKQGLAGTSESAAWVAALVSQQTTAGFLGAGNYGIARMNGGFATRPGVGLVPLGGPGARWRRDVRVLLGRRDWFFDRVEQFREADGHALLWCLPWDGKNSLALEALDPWFIEVARRVRLVQEGGRIVGRTGTSAAARVAAAAAKGNVGDPWIPINRDNADAAYNSAPRYAVMAEVLFERGKWTPPLCLEFHMGIDTTPITARFDVFVRGQGKTEGHHVRDVPVTPERLIWLTDDEQRAQIALLAKAMAEDVRTLLGGKVLRTALLSLIQSGPEQVKFGDKTASAWADKLLSSTDGRVDDAFFEQLFAHAADAPTGRAAWLAFLRQLAEDTFARAVDALPTAGPRRLKAIAVAERLLWGSFRNSFKHLEPATETADAV